MSIVDKLREVVQNDRILSALRKLEEVYDELAKEQKKWIDVSPFLCPQGCGRCCEHFIPDVWEIESLYIAAQLMTEGRDWELPDRVKGNSACPLQIYGGEGCNGYGGRGATMEITIGEENRDTSRLPTDMVRTRAFGAFSFSTP